MLKMFGRGEPSKRKIISQGNDALQIAKKRFVNQPSVLEGFRAAAPRTSNTDYMDKKHIPPKSHKTHVSNQIAVKEMIDKLCKSTGERKVRNFERKLNPLMENILETKYLSSDFLSNSEEGWPCKADKKTSTTDLDIVEIEIPPAEPVPDPPQQPRKNIKKIEPKTNSVYEKRKLLFEKFTFRNVNKHKQEKQKKSPVEIKEQHGDSVPQYEYCESEKSDSIQNPSQEDVRFMEEDFQYENESCSSFEYSPKSHRVKFQTDPRFKKLKKDDKLKKGRNLGKKAQKKSKNGVLEKYNELVKSKTNKAATEMDQLEIKAWEDYFGDKEMKELTRGKFVKGNCGVKNFKRMSKLAVKGKKKINKKFDVLQYQRNLIEEHI